MDTHSILIGAVPALLIAISAVLLFDRHQLIKELHDAERQCREAQEDAAYAERIASDAQERIEQAQNAALDAQERYLALMELYKHNVAQCLQAGLEAIVMRRRTD